MESSSFFTNKEEVKSELIDPVLGGWDKQLIWNVFYEEHVVKMLVLPIQLVWEDRIVWHFDKKKIFSVKSGWDTKEKVVSSLDDRGKYALEKDFASLFPTNSEHNNLYERMNINRCNFDSNMSYMYEVW